MINTAKERMLNGKQALGIEVGLGSAFAAELLAPLNYDYVLVDNQHGKWDETDTFNAFRSCLLYTSPSPRDGLLSRMPSSA